MLPEQMKVVIAPDKFKGTFTAAEVAAAMTASLGTGAIRVPVADGGDGTAAALLAASGGEWRSARVEDPLGRPMQARFALLGDARSAVVDVAEASGLACLAPEERDALGASSAGTGQLIAAALEAGASRILVGCGGSASTDGGVGALSQFDPVTVEELVCLCDVSDAFPAALNYAPQKGASEQDLEELRARLSTLAAQWPHDPTRLPFTGAAGGLSGGLWAHGARLVPGARFVLDAVGLAETLEADPGPALVLTGEGRLDATSLRGKAVGEVARLSVAAGVPCHAIVGSQESGAGFAPPLTSVTEAGTLKAISAAAQHVVAGAAD